MNEMELDQRTRDLLDRVRHTRKSLSVYEMQSGRTEMV